MGENVRSDAGESFPVNYEVLTKQVLALAEEEPAWVPLLSNVSALIMETLPQLNWAGFYLVRGKGLVLGPFQGKPACIHIAHGKGVCGTAWAEDKIQRVPDVHAFPGHIACDGASRSEIVVPIHDWKTGEVLGVLDLDAPIPERFSEADEAGLAALVRGLEEVIEMS